MEKKKRNGSGAASEKKGLRSRGEHLAEYVPVIIGRDNDRVAASCLWRDCRSRR